jgi:predicted Zn-dependent protease
MISRDKVNAIAKEIFDRSSVDTQIILSGGKKQMSRIGKNHVYHNLLQKDYSVKIQVAQGKKVAVCSCNSFEPDALRDTLDKACAILKHQQENPTFMGFYSDDKPIVEDRHYKDSTMQLDFSQKLSSFDGIFKKAESENIEVAGAFSHEDEVLAIVNNHGLFRYSVATDSSFTFSIMTPEGGSGWAEYHSSSVDDVKPELLFNIARKKATLSENPKEMAPGKYTVILEPPAVAGLMLFMGYMGLGGLGCLENRSYFSPFSKGDKVLGDNVTIVDDFADEQSFGPGFDYEGVPKQRMDLIRNGVFQGVALDRYVASQMKDVRSTGHGMPFPSSLGPLPVNVKMLGGDSSLDEMIASTENGILVTRFFYDNVLDPRALTMTGMTRDGTFLIKNGKIAHGLANMRYNDALPRIFSNISQLSSQTWSLRELGRMSVPAIKVEGFSFS